MRKSLVALATVMLSGGAVLGIAQGASATELPAAVACITTGGFASDEGDVAPVASSTGLDFTGPSAQAEDIYQRVSAGNAQGITSLNVTYADGSTGQPAQVVVEINPHSTLTFATLSTNLTAAQAVGTVNVLDPSVLWSSSKITPIAADNPGSISDPIPYLDLVALFPNNTLLSAPSLHLLTNSSATDHSVVTGLNSSCAVQSFLASAPAPTDTSVPTPSDSPTVLAVTGDTSNPNELADTGSNTVLGWYISAAVVIAGAGLVTIAIKRRKKYLK